MVAGQRRKTHIHRRRALDLALFVFAGKMGQAPKNINKTDEHGPLFSQEDWTIRNFPTCISEFI